MTYLHHAVGSPQLSQRLVQLQRVSGVSLLPALQAALLVLQRLCQLQQVLHCLCVCQASLQAQLLVLTSLVRAAHSRPSSPATIQCLDELMESQPMRLPAFSDMHITRNSRWCESICLRVLM